MAVDERAWGADVLGKQRAGGQARGGGGDVDVLVVVNLRQRRDGREPHRNAHGSIQRGRHRDVHVALAQVARHLEHSTHPAERRRLHHRDVGRPQLRDAIGVLDLTNRLVRRHAHEQPAAHELAAHFLQLLRSRTRLLHVIQRHHLLRGG